MYPFANHERAAMIRAQWDSFRAARGRVIAMVAAGVLIMLPGLLFAAGARTVCAQAQGRVLVEKPCAAPLSGPDGHAVSDRFFFLHRQLDGDGSITARVGPMTGRIKKPPPPGTGPGPEPVPGVVPWAKAGIMIKKSAVQGAAYAAVMATAGHGVRMQHDFIHDTAGTRGSRWLRLTRTGKTITGYESPDGRRWTPIATAELEGPARIGLFAASPGEVTRQSTSSAGRFAEVTATLDQVSARGANGAWSRDDIGVEPGLDGRPHHPGGVVASGGTYTLTGVGDIAPLVAGPRVEHTLIGLMIGLIVMIVVAASFGAADDRRAATPASRELVARAAVIAGISALTGLVAAAVAVGVGGHLARANATLLLPVSPLTEVRVVVGAAASCAAVAVLALALGALWRRAAFGVIGAMAVVIVPEALSAASMLPEAVAWGVFRFTPAAGFATLQSIPAYPQVDGAFVPSAGFYPLPPWAGLAVLCCYAGLTLGLAVKQARTRGTRLDER